jgi:Cys-tRNA(Pro)/Cys-tRNA(Cys) deacylase
VGGKRADTAEVRRAERASGYVKGGISPSASASFCPRWLTPRCSSMRRVRERRALEIELPPQDLIAALAATVAAIAR